MAWQWEGDWHIETTLDGQPLDHDVNKNWVYYLFKNINYGRNGFGNEFL